MAKTKDAPSKGGMKLSLKVFLLLLPVCFAWSLTDSFLSFTVSVSTGHDLEQPYMSGLFAPTAPSSSSSAIQMLEGALPTALSGYFLQMCPNRLYGGEDNRQLLNRHHWFEGSGQVQAVRIKDGKITEHRAEMMQTTPVIEEAAAGKWMYEFGFGELLTGGFSSIIILISMKLRELTGFVPYGGDALTRGPANTDMLVVAGRTFAVAESSLPFEVTLGNASLGGSLLLASEGYVNLASSDGSLQWDGPVTAHSKTDPVTGEVFMYGLDSAAGHFVVGHLSPAAELMNKVLVPATAGLIVAHDFAITSRHILLVESSFGLQAKYPHFADFKPDTPMRIGVRDRYSSDPEDTTWFSSPPLHLWHVANAWEEIKGDTTTIWLLATGAEWHAGYFINPAGMSAAEYEASHAHLYLWQMYLTGPLAGTVSRKDILPHLVMEMPTIHPGLVGRPCTSVYLSVLDTSGRDGLKRRGLARLEVDTSNVEEPVKLADLYSLDPIHIGALEARFVPSTPPPRVLPVDEAAEKAGVLMGFVWDTVREESLFVARNAANLSQIVAKAALGLRVPMGFHAEFFWDSELHQSQ